MASIPPANLLVRGDGADGSTSITDSSTYAWAITRNNGPVISTLQFPTGATSSIRFRGTTAGSSNARDSLTFTPDATWAVGTSPFTLEAWVYPVSGVTSGEKAIFRFGAAFPPANTFMTLAFDAGRLFLYDTQAGVICRAINAIANGQWYHVAAVREGIGSNQTKIYVNGAQVAQGTQATNLSLMSDSRRIFEINSTADVYAFDAYFSNCRVVWGTALYTRNFVPPVAPLAATVGARSTFLVTGEGANGSTTFTDIAGGNTINRFGNTQISTASAPTGMTSSIYFDGVGDYLTALYSNLQTGPFTLECWTNFESFASPNTDPTVFQVGADQNNRIGVYRNSSNGRIDFYIVTNGSYFLNPATSVTVQLNTWYHLAFVNTGSTRLFFINGVQVGSSTAALPSSNLNSVVLGSQNFDSGLGIVYHKGYISNFRISPLALYTANFTPSTPPLSIDGPPTLATAITNNVYGIRQLT